MKLIWDNIDETSARLYNLTEDIRESNNLANLMPNLVDKLRQAMLEVEKKFTEPPIGSCPSSCPFSTGITPWGEAATHLFCDESAVDCPPDLNNTDLEHELCDSEGDCTAGFFKCDSKKLYCSQANPRVEKVSRCNQCTAVVNERCGSQRPPCCKPLRCEKKNGMGRCVE